MTWHGLCVYTRWEEIIPAAPVMQTLNDSLNK